jgi:hypothetical protein
MIERSRYPVLASEELSHPFRGGLAYAAPTALVRGGHEIVGDASALAKANSTAELAV